MTDTEIIKALSCCRDYVPCKNYCPYAKYKCTIDRECIPKLCEDALDLITRQKEEIERLKDMVSQNEGVLPRYEALSEPKPSKSLRRKSKSIVRALNSMRISTALSKKWRTKGNGK